MSRCSFLSTSRNETECFGECVFYNWEENGGICPFKNLSGDRMGKFKNIFQYDMLEEDELNIKGIEEYYTKEYS